MKEIATRQKKYVILYDSIFFFLGVSRVHAFKPDYIGFASSKASFGISVFYQIFFHTQNSNSKYLIDGSSPRFLIRNKKDNLLYKVFYIYAEFMKEY